MNTGRCQLADIQLTGNSGERENIIVVVGHFVGDKFLVVFSDEIVFALIDEQIAFEGRFLVVGDNAGLETAVGSFNVAVAVVDTDDDGIGVVIHKIHSVSFLPHSGDTHSGNTHSGDTRIIDGLFFGNSISSKKLYSYAFESSWSIRSAVLGPMGAYSQSPVFFTDIFGVNLVKGVFTVYAVHL